MDKNKKGATRGVVEVLECFSTVSSENGMVEDKLARPQANEGPRCVLPYRYAQTDSKR